MRKKEENDALWYQIAFLNYGEDFGALPHKYDAR